jgi:hypothetical protein
MAADPGAGAALRLLFNIIDLMTDRDRERVTADLTALAAAMKQALAIQADIERAQHLLDERAEALAKREQELASREDALGVREQQAQLELRRAEEKRLELEQLKSEMRSWAKAA